MNSILLLFVLTVLIVPGNSLLGLSKKSTPTPGDTVVRSTVKIYSNLAEIIKPLGLLPIEFTAEDWSDIRPDSVTLVGTNVTITQQTITEKKKSLDKAEVYVRSPTSSNTETKFIKATLIDEKRNLVKLIDKDISKEPIFFTPPLDHIVYESDPPQSKYYVNFIYDTTDAVYVSYLRSNLNWKTRYQLNLFDGAKNPVLISMADIRNDGQSKVDIDHAELLGGDINLQMYGQNRWHQPMVEHAPAYAAYGPAADGGFVQKGKSPSITRAEEVAGLYIFPINQPFSIEAKTNYLLPMFRPHVTIERYATVSTYFYGVAGNSNGKAQRSYRLSSDIFLSNGNCIIRESDRLVGETTLPNLAAKDKHDFSVGQDADIVYRENATLLSSQNITSSTYRMHPSTRSTYEIHLCLKNYKKNRPVKVEYEQHLHGSSVKLVSFNKDITQEGSSIKFKPTLGANEEKTITYKVEITN